MSEPERIASVDAARGVAMIFVCLSHFSWLYFELDGRSVTAAWVQGFSQVASPMFMSVSGMVLGLLYRTALDFGAIRRKLLDRALLLLIVVHFLIVVAHVPRSGSLEAALRWCFITDAIGFALLTGPLLIVRLSAAARVLSAVTIFALSWVLVVGWHPDVLVWRMVKDVLVGPFDAAALSYTFPFLPWFAVYLGSTVLGERLARDGERGTQRSYAQVLALVGATSVVIALAGKAAYWWLRATDRLPSGEALSVVVSLASPWKKLPPSPEYVLLFGGAGLLLGAMVFAMRRRPRLAPLFGWLALLGRNTLFVFVLQYYVYFVVLLGFERTLRVVPGWIWFVSSIVVFSAAARGWDRCRGNRFLTVFGAWAMAHTLAARAVRRLAVVTSDAKAARPLVRR